MKYPTLLLFSILIIFVESEKIKDDYHSSNYITFPKRQPFEKSQLGEDCKTFDGKKGKCMKNEKCSKFSGLMKLWYEKKYISYAKAMWEVYRIARSDCGFDGKEALICCNENSSAQDWVKIIKLANAVTEPNLKNSKEEEKQEQEKNDINSDDKNDYDEAYYKDSNEV